ncbi:MAG: CPBP family intramembrane glutamic endopeptidase [Verrucomicrobiota bacterium]
MLSAKPWKPDLVLRLLLGMFASISLGIIIVHGLESDEIGLGGESSKWLTFIVGTLSFHGMSFVLINIFLREHEIGWAAAFGFNAPRLGRALLLAAIVGFAVLPIAASLNHLSMQVLHWLEIKAELQQAVQTLQTTVSLSQKLYFGIVAICVAPAVEELLFRGILYPTIKQRGYKRFALWSTSLFFAAIHANLMTFVPLTFLALILTLLYETTDNILAPVLAHSLFNAANFFWLVSGLPVG